MNRLLISILTIFYLVITAPQIWAMSGRYALKAYLYASKADTARVARWESGMPTVFDEAPDHALTISEKINLVYPEIRKHVVTIPRAAGKLSLFGHMNQVSLHVESPDKKYIITGSTDTSIRLWNAQTKACSILAGHSQPITRATMSPDNKFVITGSQDGEVIFWDLEHDTGTICKGHETAIHKITFFSEASMFITESSNLEYHWSYTRSLKGVAIQPVTDLEKQEVILSNPIDQSNQQKEENYLNIFDIRPQQIIIDYLDPADGSLSPWSFHKTYRKQSGGVSVYPWERDNFITISQEQSQSITNPTKDNVFLIENQHPLMKKLFNKKLSAIAVHNFGIYKAIGTSHGCIIFRANNSSPKTFSADDEHSAVTALAFSHDGKQLAAAFANNHVKIWDVEKLINGSPIQACIVCFELPQLNYPESVKESNKKPLALYLFAFSLDNKKLYAYANHESAKNGFVTEYNCQTQQIDKICEIKPAHVAAFSADGEYLVIANRAGRLDSWSPVGPLARIPNRTSQDINSILHHTSYRMLSDKNNLFYSLRPVTILANKMAEISALKIQDSKLFVSCPGNQNIVIFDLVTNKQCEILENPSQVAINMPNQLAISRDGLYLASGSIEGGLHIWRQDNVALILKNLTLRDMEARKLAVAKAVSQK
jgi:WD40 repeat protein